MLDVLKRPLQALTKTSGKLAGTKKVDKGKVRQIQTLSANLIRELDDLPPSLQSWVVKIASPFTFLPESYLMDYEQSRLCFESMGALCNQNDSRK